MLNERLNEVWEFRSGEVTAARNLHGREAAGAAFLAELHSESRVVIYHKENKTLTEGDGSAKAQQSVTPGTISVVEI